MHVQLNLYKSTPPQASSINRSSIIELSKAIRIPLNSQLANMKCFTVAALFALVVAVAFAETKPTETESIEPARAEPISPEAARNKRGLLLSAGYTAPIAYSAYTAPALAYSAYSYPYAYAAYSTYPYYAATYRAPYYLA